MNKRIKKHIEKTKKVKEEGKEVHYCFVESLPDEVWTPYETYGNTVYYESNLGRYKSYTVVESKFVISHRERLNKHKFYKPRPYYDFYEDSNAMACRLGELTDGSKERYKGEANAILRTLYPNEEF